MFDSLLAFPGVEERCELRSRFGFLALHGGLEAGTAEIADAAAHVAGASLYAVVQPDDLHWHVPSHYFDPSLSPGLRDFLAHVDVVISVHGFGGLRGTDERWTTALLGGGNRTLAAHLASQLRTALPHYRWVDDLSVMPVRLRGVHAANPVNRPARKGVQIELPPRVRRPGDDLEGLIDVLGEAMRSQETQAEATGGEPEPESTDENR
jgi:phage replication-related protein YjqB (UPF0714/DUF867 family)